ncbi:MAG: chemotaxis protein CheW [Deltaproteobacteria bacterium]
MKKKITQTADFSDSIQLICFKLGAEEYGFDIMQIKEIMRYQKITPIPKAASFIEGVINLRGMVIPVIDLRKRFELPVDVNIKCRIIIAQVETKIVGLIIDDVTDIVTLPKTSILPSPKTVKGVEVEYLDGMADMERGLLLVLNLNRLLTAEEKGAIDESLERGKK